MTENNAGRLLKEIITILECESRENNFPDDIQRNILENCIEIKVDEYEEKHIIFLSDKPISLKLPNVIFNLEQAIKMTVEFLLSFSIPDSDIKAVKMILLVVFKMAQLSATRLTTTMAEIVLALHRLNAYKIPIEIIDIEKSIESQDINIDKIINDLYKYNIIDISDGKVLLKERVVYVK